jgi:acyl-CoA dehydrogenase
VRVPAANQLGQEGDGFLMAQARLGPGRIHHCMRSIGQCELALELMRERALDRRAFGKAVADQANIAEWIARSRLEIEQARLLVLKTAWMIDTLGAKAARQEIALIKVLVPKLQTTVIDRAIQVFGAMGLSPDTPLAYLWTWGRALEILDGPTEVHLRTIARYEFNAAKETMGEAAAYMLPPEALMGD